MNNKLKLSFSPCPNDTFIFHALVHNLVPHDFTFDVHFADIQELNQGLDLGLPDVSKASFPAIKKNLDQYCFLPVGAALGKGNGPKIVAKPPFSLDQLPHKSIAIPGKDTTAYSLYQMLCPSAKREHFCLYHEIAGLIQDQKVDCGLIIHETRFVLKELGLVEICDLGQLWETRMQLPLPLGGLVAKKSLGEAKIQALTQAIQASIAFAWRNPELSIPYILEHSAEKKLDVVRSHIELYVNSESFSLSSEGKKAVDIFLSAQVITPSMEDV